MQQWCSLIVRRVNEYLQKHLGLRLKENWQVFRFDYIDHRNSQRKGRPLDFMRFKFYKDKTILRRSIMLRATRKARRIGKKPNVNWRDASSMLSYMGWVTHTDTYCMYLLWIKPYINVKQMKKIVSKHQKKVNRREQMEKRILSSATR